MDRLVVLGRATVAQWHLTEEENAGERDHNEEVSCATSLGPRRRRETAPEMMGFRYLRALVET